jgi:aspartokinase-like uncharacterized kinase
MALTVAKVGGSLYDLPDLRLRLKRWLHEWAGGQLLLVPGGGATADAVRTFHRNHGVSEERCHWLALRALSLNAHFLEGILESGTVVKELGECAVAWEAGLVPVLDLYAFALADEDRPGHLAHTWEVTSDALAARVAVVAEARRLVLLKSDAIPPGVGWEEAARRGYVDPAFVGVVRVAPELEVRAIDFRAGGS